MQVPEALPRQEPAHEVQLCAKSKERGRGGDSAMSGTAGEGDGIKFADFPDRRANDQEKSARERRVDEMSIFLFSFFRGRQMVLF